MSYRVTTKKNLIIFHEPAEWAKVLNRLVEDFGTRIRMRHLMRRELGFTVRDHQGLEPNRLTGQFQSMIDLGQGMHYQPQVHLDFYTEAAQSWFILKYL